MKYVRLLMLYGVMLSSMAVLAPCRLLGQTHDRSKIGDARKVVSYDSIDDWTDAPVLIFHSTIPFESYREVQVWNDGRIAWEVAKKQKIRNIETGRFDGEFYKSKIPEKSVKDVIDRIEKTLALPAPFKLKAETPALYGINFNLQNTRIKYLTKEYYFDNGWPLFLLYGYERRKDQFEEADDKSIIDAVKQLEEALGHHFEILSTYQVHYKEDYLATREAGHDVNTDAHKFARQFSHEIKIFLLFRELIVGLVPVNANVLAVEVERNKYYLHNLVRPVPLSNK